jgi:transposase
VHSESAYNKMLKLPQCPWGRGSHQLETADITGPQRRWLANAHIVGGISIADLGRRFGVRPTTISNWVQIVRKGGIIDRKCGAPAKIAPAHLQQLVNLTRDDTYSHLCKREDDWDINMAEAVVATAVDRGIATCKVKPISRRTVVRYKEKIDFHTGNAKTTTTARAEAVHDPRNALSFAAMNACCVPMSTPELIINVDATQFTVGDKDYAPPKAVWCGKRPDNVKVMPKKGDGLTSYFVKYYATITAAGAQADPIYIVADDGMAVNDIHVNEVIGIGAGPSPREKAWIVFSKTRVPRIDFYKWYLKMVFIPWVQELRQIYSIGADIPAYFQLDGEAAQIGPFLTDPYIRQLMAEHNIMVGKPPASTSSTTQALDAGPLFEGSKCVLKDTTDAQFLGDWRVGALRDVWDRHKVWVSARGGVSAISDANRKSGIYGILRIHQSTTRNFHSKGITDSFRVTGLYPFDLSVILGNCTADITAEEQLHYCSMLGRLKKHFMQHAEIKEWFFDRLGIRAGQDRSFDKAVQHRRSILLSSDAFWAGQQDKALAKELAATAKEANKERIRLEKIEKEQKKTDKEAAKRAKTAPAPAPAPAIVIPPPPPPPPPLPTTTTTTGRAIATPKRFR